MQTFHEYLKSSGQRLSTIAKKIGKSHSYMSEIAGGKKMPSLRTAVAIEDATDGKIPARYWLSHVPPDQNSG